jgi:hypothetical protein
MTLTVTSLTHPTMIAKIRAAMYYASKGEGHKMDGHGNRCYIQNSKGHNIMRLNWVGGKDGIIVYGDQARNITPIVKAALKAAKVRDFASAYNANNANSSQLSKIALMCGLTLVLTGCQAPGAMTVLFSFVESLFA